MQISTYLTSLKKLALEHKVEAAVVTTVFVVAIILVWYFLSKLTSSGFATNPTAVRDLIQRDQFLNTREPNFTPTTSDVDDYLQDAAKQSEESFTSKKASKDDQLSRIVYGFA